MLEAITARYYRIRPLTSLHSLEFDGQCYATAEYLYEGKHIHVFATHSEYGRLAEAVAGMALLLARVPPAHDIVLDFYTWHNGALDDAEAKQQEIQRLLSLAPFARPNRRIVVTVAGPGHGDGISGMLHFTYRRSDAGYTEEKLYRGLHPMMGKRLHLWRLGNFNLERLPSVEDVYLLHAVAHDNPKDVRLFACAEVRDVTAVRDPAGRVVQLPHLERMWRRVLASIRLYQSRRPPQERLHWNRIFLYVWPPLNLGRDELDIDSASPCPIHSGLGLEQVVLRVRIPNPATGELRDMIVRISTPAGTGSADHIPTRR